MSENGKLVVQDEVVALFDTAKFEHMYRVAKLMASSDLMPKHLMGKEANCMLIVQQALRWKMDPFAMAQGTFVVSNKLGYEGKVVAAVVNTRAALKERLKYDVSGEGQNCSVVVRGTFQGEDEERTVAATWAEGKALSPHGAKWKELPDQQLCYYAARKWARRHCPELILGVLSDDEVEAMSRHVGPDYAKDVGGHSEAHNPIASLDALADQIETKATPEPHTMPSDDGGGFMGDSTAEDEDAAPEPPQAQHGMAHEQEGFDLGPTEIQIDTLKPGRKPTFGNDDDALQALHASLDELTTPGKVGELCARNIKFIKSLPPVIQESWQQAVDDTVVALQDNAA